MKDKERYVRIRIVSRKIPSLNDALKKRGKVVDDILSRDMHLKKMPEVGLEPTPPVKMTRF